MSKLRKIGQEPGTLSDHGAEKAAQGGINLIEYDQTSTVRKRYGDIDEILPLPEFPGVKWINVGGPYRVETLEKLGSFFRLHPLVLEDILNIDQRPKLEDFNSYLFVVLKILQYNDHSSALEEKQFSLILGPNYVLSFLEKDSSFFDPIMERIENTNSRLRMMKADYLAHAMLDLIVDHYFSVLEKLGENIETLEESLVGIPNINMLHTLHSLRREILMMRKQVWPIREVISTLARGESMLVEESTRIYFHDIYDHLIQVLDMVEMYREALSGMLDLYLSSSNMKMNEIMKLLTIIATIFIPLTFITGIYGMNFMYMPELKLTWGYPAALLVMLAVSLGMVFYFRKRKWF